MDIGIHDPRYRRAPGVLDRTRSERQPGGTTGAQPDLPDDLPARISDLHRATDLPLAVGFGVTTAAHVRALAAGGADGIVVGSAIVRKLGENLGPEAVERFVAELTLSLSS